MTDLQGDARAAYVQRMFGRIARRYDLLNRLMTAGQDRRWRSEVIRRSQLQPGESLLDLGCGTGDLALEAARRTSAGLILGADFTLPMLAVARKRPGADRVRWVIADAQSLPFASGAFDAVVSGFLMRNVSDLDAVLGEQRRLLRPSSGRMICLDTTPPGASPLRPVIEFHLRRVIPALGRWIAGDAEAYNYLPGSTRGFLSAEALAEAMRRAGFESVGFVRRMFSTIAIHWGTRSRKDVLPRGGRP